MSGTAAVSVTELTDTVLPLAMNATPAQANSGGRPGDGLENVSGSAERSRRNMAIITGADGDFGRLVAEEYKRRAQRVVDVGQAAPDADMDDPPAGDDRADEGPAHPPDVSR